MKINVFAHVADFLKITLRVEIKSISSFPWTLYKFSRNIKMKNKWNKGAAISQNNKIFCGSWSAIMS